MLCSPIPGFLETPARAQAMPDCELAPGFPLCRRETSIPVNRSCPGTCNLFWYGANKGTRFFGGLCFFAFHLVRRYVEIQEKHRWTEYLDRFIKKDARALHKQNACQSQTCSQQKEHSVRNWHLVQLPFEIVIVINIVTCPRIIRICIIIMVYRY